MDTNNMQHCKLNYHFAIQRTAEIKVGILINNQKDINNNYNKRILTSRWMELFVCQT